MANTSEAGPVLSWTTVVSAAAFMTALVGGGWTVFQTQFSSMSAQIIDNKREAEKGFNLYQAQLDRRFEELNKSLNTLRIERLTLAEFSQFKEAMLLQLDLLRKQLAILEQTRPTTGELQAYNKSSQEALAAAANVSSTQMHEIEGRLRAVEQYNLGQSKTFVPTQPKQ